MKDCACPCCRIIGRDERRPRPVAVEDLSLTDRDRELLDRLVKKLEAARSDKDHQER